METVEMAPLRYPRVHFFRAHDPDNECWDADGTGNNNEAMRKRRSEDENDGAAG